MQKKVKLLLILSILLIKNFAYCSSYTQKDSILYPVEVLSKYLQFPSYSGKEYEAGKYLIDVCRENGLNVTVFTDTGGSKNFAASLYPLSLKKPNIVFHHHKIGRAHV